MRVARRARTLFYGALWPLDRLFLKLNKLSNYPPIHLRRHVHPLGAGLNGPSYEFVTCLRLLAGLKNGQSLWDVGCGCGLLELALADLGWEGRLTGTDIHRPSIRWAQRRLGTSLARHSFEHMDVFNAAYWPAGRLTTEQWLDTFAGSDFDVVIAKSLFTHVLPDEMDVYFRGIAPRLKIGGRALFTFFLLDGAQQKASAAGLPKFTFEPFASDPRCFVRRPLAPTAAVAYPREYVVGRLVAAGFRADRIAVHPGTWSGRADGLSEQDVIVAER